MRAPCEDPHRQTLIWTSKAGTAVPANVGTAAAAAAAAATQSDRGATILQSKLRYSLAG